MHLTKTNIISREKIVPKADRSTKQGAFSKLALFLKVCQNITFEGIKDTVIGQLIKLEDRSSCLRTFQILIHTLPLYHFKCEFADVPEGWEKAFLELQSNIEVHIEFKNKANLLFFGC